MEKEGFKVGLPQSPASVGGLLKLIGPALLICNPVEGTEELDKAWIKLFPGELLLQHQGKPDAGSITLSFHHEELIYIFLDYIS